MENRARAGKCEACEHPRGTSPKEAAAKEKEKAKRLSGEGKKGEKPVAAAKAVAAVAAAAAKAASKKTRSSSGSAKSSSGGGGAAASAKKKKAMSKVILAPVRKSGGGGGGSSSSSKKAKKPQHPQPKQERQTSGASATGSSGGQGKGKGKEKEDEGPQIVIGCTGLEPAVKEVVCKQTKELAKALATRRSGVRVKYSQSADPSAPVTHLLVPADGREPRRTAKVLFALARGAHVVTTDWLAASVKALQPSGAGGEGEDEEETQAAGPLDEAAYATPRFPPRTAQQGLLAGEGGPVFLAPTCVDPGDRVLVALIKGESV
jgi:hypothetical protein